MYTWSEQLPDKPGKYIVKTVSTYGKFFKNEHILQATLTINEKGEKHWNFKNQLFKAYLKESQNEKV